MTGLGYLEAILRLLRPSHADEAGSRSNLDCRQCAHRIPAPEHLDVSRARCSFREIEYTWPRTGETVGPYHPLCVHERMGFNDENGKSCGREARNFELAPEEYRW